MNKPSSRLVVRLCPVLSGCVHRGDKRRGKNNTPLTPLCEGGI